jgi:hypothetical protein
MSDKFELVPDNFFQEVFSYYGLKSSSFFLFSGIAVSGLGLDDYINPALWILAASIGLVLAYSVRDYVTERYGLLLSLFLCSLLAIGIAASLSPAGPSPVDTWPERLAFVAIAAVLVASVSMLMTSYRKHNESRSVEAPPPIKAAIARFITDAGLYYPSFAYRVVARPAATVPKVELKMELKFSVGSYAPRNREFIARFPKSTEQFELRKLIVAGVSISTDNPSIWGDDAVRITQVIPRGETVEFVVETVEVFEGFDSELYAAYEYPAEHFSFVLDHGACPNHVFWVEALHNQRNDRPEEGSRISWTADHPLLPFQGLRLLWRTRNAQ